MTKKVLFLIVILVLSIFIIQGCGNNSTTNTIKPDTIPPVFSGVIGLIPTPPPGGIIGASYYFLTWEAAVDNVTPQNRIVYLIFSYTGSREAFNWSSIYATTEAGATSYEVTAPVYYLPTYFGVRAKDEAGNIDTNTVLISNF